jgi:hypothetical protein
MKCCYQTTEDQILKKYHLTLKLYKFYTYGGTDLIGKDAMGFLKRWLARTKTAVTAGM